MSKENTTEEQFGSVEIEGLWDDITETLEEQIPESEKEENTTTEEQESEEKSEESTKDEKSEEPVSEEVKEESEESEESEDFIDDDKIFETYGEDVDPALVRHYNVVQDYLLLSEDFEFNGKNLEEAYEEDVKNRNSALAQKLLDRLPSSYRTVLEAGIKNAEELTPETFDYLLKAGQEEINNTYDQYDENSVKEYVRTALLESGVADLSDVDDIVETYADKDKLDTVAAKYKEKKDEYLQSLRVAKIEEDKERARQLRERDQGFRAKVNNVIDSTGYKNVRKATLKKYIYGRGQGGGTPMIDSLKHIYNNPEALIKLADMLTYYDTKTGNWDMSRFEKKETTKQTKKVKGKIEQKLSGNKAFKTSRSRKGKVDFDWDEVDV